MLVLSGALQLDFESTCKHLQAGKNWVIVLLAGCKGACNLVPVDHADVLFVYSVSPSYDQALPCYFLVEHCFTWCSVV